MPRRRLLRGRRFRRRPRRFQRRTIRKRSRRVSRFGRQGSIKFHRFVDRGVGWFYCLGTASGSGPYAMSWPAMAVGSETMLDPSSNWTPWCISFSPTGQSAVYNANSPNYNWVRLGKVILHLSPNTSEMTQASGSGNPTGAGKGILTNYQIPIEYMASPAAGSAFSGNIGTPAGDMALEYSSYAYFLDDPNTHARPIQMGNKVLRHKWTISPKVATPFYVSTNVI